MRRKGESMLRPRTRFLLALIILVSFLLTLNVEVVETSDYSHNLFLARTILETGRIPPQEPPVVFYLLAALVKIFGEIKGLQAALGIGASLVALPAFLVARKLSDSEEAGLLMAAVAVMNPFSYYLVRYCVLKNLIGNVFLLGGMALLHRQTEEGSCRNMVQLAGMSVLLMFTHVISFYTYLAYLATHTIHSFLNGKPLKVILPALAFAPFLLAVPLLVNNDLNLFTGVFPLVFNFPRFVEAWTYVPVATSLYVALATLYQEWNLRPAPTAAALTALVLHAGSWITKHGIGVRLMYMAYIPLVLTLATHLKPGGDRRPWIFLAAAYIPQYLAHHIPGGWL